jgi:hypothetical protein
MAKQTVEQRDMGVVAKMVGKWDFLTVLMTVGDSDLL